MSDAPHVVFIGPLPPPVHGFSVINEAMLAALQTRTAVTVFNRRSLSGLLAQPFSRAAQFLAWLPRLVALLWRRPSSFYIALSGGSGQIVDLIYLGVARLCAARIHVHHHSYAYINAPTRLSRLVFRTARSATHIFLSEGMRERFAAAYPGAVRDHRILSNAAFVAPPERAASTVADALSPLHSAPTELTLAYLSAVSEEKGALVFLEILDGLRAAGQAVRGVIAGPLDEALGGRFLKAVSERSHVSYVGPLHGEHKQRHLDAADLLLFPSRYANEAQPVTLFEALASGLTCVASDRGSIAEQIPTGCGRSVRLENMPDAVAQEVAVLRLLDPAARHRLRASVAERFRQMHAVEQLSLAQLVATITS